MSLSQKLKDLRARKGLSQAALADILGLSQQAIGKWERDKSTPDYDTLLKISNYFNVPIDDLLGSRFTSGLLGDPKDFGRTANINPPPEFYTNPETQRRMEEIWNDPKRQRIFIASKELQPEELDKIADLMETIIAARKGH